MSTKKKVRLGGPPFSLSLSLSVSLSLSCPSFLSQPRLSVGAKGQIDADPEQLVLIVTYEAASCRESRRVECVLCAGGGILHN